MGIPLVQGSDLFVEDGLCYMRTTRGPARVDVIYRRIDDAFLDPLQFNPESMLGVPGLISAYLGGGVTIVNAPGTGVADDKAVYTYVEDMVRFYLSEEPAIKSVETYRCAEPKQLSHVLANLENLVVKEVHGSGGYGMLIGPRSTKEEREAYAERLKAKPHAFIAQPTLALSTCPTLVEEGIAPRHVDFRPIRSDRQEDAPDTGRPDPRCPSRGFARGQFQPGWRRQGHVGPQPINAGRPLC